MAYLETTFGRLSVCNRHSAGQQRDAFSLVFELKVVIRAINTTVVRY